MARLLAVVALVAAAGVVAFLAGSASASRTDPASSGFDPGSRSGRPTAPPAARGIAPSAGPARARPDAPRPADASAARDAAFRAGRRAGFRAGRADGLAAARAARRRAPRPAAPPPGTTTVRLPSFPGGWHAQHWYLVRLDPGDQASVLRVSERVLVARGRAYAVCARDANRVCTSPAPAP